MPTLTPDPAENVHSLLDPAGVRRVAVLGAGGTVGASWVALFLHAGLDVIAQDPAPGAPARVEAFVARAWPALDQLRAAAPLPAAAATSSGDAGGDSGNSSGSGGTRQPGRLEFHTDPVAAVAEADFVQENAPENEALKIELLAALDAAARPEIVIASSTSALLRSRIVATCRQRPERVLVAHPFNPPHLLPLVEIVGARPDDPAVRWAVRFYRDRLGKRPVVLQREAVGHIANRLSSALYREAVHLVEAGIASVADIDAAVASGPGLRWAIFGPHLLYHLGGGPGGIAHYLQHLGPSQERRWAELGDPKLTAELQEKIVAGVLAEAAGRDLPALEAERDRALLALLAALLAARPAAPE